MGGSGVPSQRSATQWRAASAARAPHSAGSLPSAMQCCFSSSAALAHRVGQSGSEEPFPQCMTHAPSAESAALRQESSLPPAATHASNCCSAWSSQSSRQSGAGSVQFSSTQWARSCCTSVLQVSAGWPAATHCSAAAFARAVQRSWQVGSGVVWQCSLMQWERASAAWLPQSSAVPPAVTHWV